MIKRLLIHIGDPKTGTSSIQAALQAGACHCASVTIWPQKELNAVGLGKSLAPKSGNPHDRVAQFSRLARWARQSDADIGVVSSEFFERVAPQDLRSALEEFVPELAQDVRILAYVRPHCGRFVSAYGQRIKTGAFTGPPKQLAKKLIENEFLSYLPRFKAWEACFGANFTLRPFVRSALFRGDIVEDFFNVVLEGAAFELSGAFRINEALAVEEMAALRHLHVRLIEQSLDRSLRHQVGSAVSDALSGLNGRFERRLELTARDASEIVKKFGSDARAMDDHFFGAPVLQEAMQQAAAQATGTFPNVKPEVYFSEGRLARIQRAADALSVILKERPKDWMQDRLVQEGQFEDTLATKLVRKLQDKHIAQVWALVAELAELMLPEETLQDAVQGV